MNDPKVYRALQRLTGHSWRHRSDHYELRVPDSLRDGIQRQLAKAGITASIVEGSETSIGKHGTAYLTLSLDDDTAKAALTASPEPSGRGGRTGRG